jgi:penicillin amidase
LGAALAAVMPTLPAADTASNAWAVAGVRTVSGKPVLANDPHLGFRAPNIWYLARLDTPELTLAGVTAPGVPFHVLGHNGHIAWGMTTTGADSQAVVRETLAPGRPGYYLTPQGPRPFVTREEIIKVRGGADFRITVRETRNGPIVLNDEKGPVALRSTALRPDDATAPALYTFNRARDWPGFTRAVARFHSPVQNRPMPTRRGISGFPSSGGCPCAEREIPAVPGRSPMPTS